MATAPEPSLGEHVWTIAVARILFGPEMNIQAPPNLQAGSLDKLIGAGINDWGGVSPVTPDHVNPEAPWPELVALEKHTAEAGKQLVQRLAVYPSYALDAARWIAPKLAPKVLSTIDADGLARGETWMAGTTKGTPAVRSPGVAAAPVGDDLRRIVDRAVERP